MKKEGGYRFSLQFPGDTEAQVRVGETLKRLGRKKSSFIVKAVTAYLDSHPEEEQRPSHPADTAVLTRDEIKGLILSVINEMHLHTAVQMGEPQEKNDTMQQESGYPVCSDAQQADIDAMLKSLDIFN